MGTVKCGKPATAGNWLALGPENASPFPKVDTHAGPLVWAMMTSTLLLANNWFSAFVASPRDVANACR